MTETKAFSFFDCIITTRTNNIEVLILLLSQFKNRRQEASSFIEIKWTMQTMIMQVESCQA